jgi:hypothetical protein
VKIEKMSRQIFGSNLSGPKGFTQATALLAKITLQLKESTWANALAYSVKVLGTEKKSFIVLTPGKT